MCMLFEEHSIISSNSGYILHIVVRKNWNIRPRILPCLDIKLTFVWKSVSNLIAPDGCYIDSLNSLFIFSHSLTEVDESSKKYWIILVPNQSSSSIFLPRVKQDPNETFIDFHETAVSKISHKVRFLVMAWKVETTISKISHKVRFLEMAWNYVSLTPKKKDHFQISVKECLR